MGAVFRFEPPPVDARILVAAAGALAVDAAGELLLEASQALVPVDTGELKASGKVEHEGPHKVRISYDATAKDGYEYGIRQHEDATLNHPHGGEDHFLSKPMATEAAALLGAMAASIGAVL